MAPKKKGQTLSLGAFLGDQALGSWADEMEDMPMPAGGGGNTSSYGRERPTFGSGGGFGADRGGSYADRGFATREELPLPSKPPYTAHLGNLSFDATEGDVNDFFADCEVTNVRIVEDKLDRKPKGFGYVEFGSVEGLKKALALSGTQFQGRNVRVSVAEPPKDRPEQRDISDWTRKGPLPDLPGQRRSSERGSGFGRGFDAGASDAGSERGDRRRAPAFEREGNTRDFGNWERKGPLSPVTGPPAGGESLREGGRQSSFAGGARERRPEAAWGEGRGADDSRGPRREFQPQGDRPQYNREPTAPELDNQWRSKMRADAVSPTATPDASVPSSPAPQSAAPASRPRLNLAKRTVSEAPQVAETSSSDKPNPFGAARPIDTAAREKMIEEKRQLAIREKKEAEEKARAEKKAREAAEKPTPKEEAPTTPAAESKDDVPEEKAVDEETPNGQDENANGEIVEDKAVKPQEVVRDPPKSAGGSWRKKPDAPAAPAGTTTQTLDEDGWSTVTKPAKNAKSNRRGGAPARAIAS